MTLVRHLALWLAAAIMMIGVSLMPSVASAHAGHGHGAAAHASTAKADVAASPEMAKASAVKAEARLLCSGPCCIPSGHVCSSCYSAGLMPAAELFLGVPRHDEAELARDVPSPPGIVPEALPEPPRPFA